MTTITNVLRDRVASALAETGATPISSTTEAVVAKVAPIVAHATNAEPWYRSRVTWGAIIAITAPILSALGVSADVLDPDLAVSISTAVATAVGGLLTLYGRWKAKKPL
ncbi:hypothetical protein [Frigidibacter sp. MR17.24]|uniref:hypothetical protein n=1 Tax=Frigidibacter sp. MR17.24 TaxID=3127345 RepID=UPI003012C79B